MLALAVRTELASTTPQRKEKTPEDGQVWLKILISPDHLDPRLDEA